MNHSRGRRIKATFSDGSVVSLTTEKGFTHAWQVTGLKRARPATINGWARSEALAQQAAAAHARSAAKHWKIVKIEVVEIKALP
jgi:ribosomal protein S11